MTPLHELLSIPDDFATGWEASAQLLENTARAIDEMAKRYASADMKGAAALRAMYYRDAAEMLRDHKTRREAEREWPCLDT